MAKTSMSKRPTQKVGRAEVMIEADTLRLSNVDARLLEETTPRTMPMMIDKIVETPSSTRVFWSLPCCMTCVAMGAPFW